jgi:hypothetical protein
MAKIWTNHKGETVPAKYVPKMDKLKERTAIKLHKQALDLNKRLTAFKKNLIDECDAIYEQMLKDAKIPTGKKGNYSITTFDKSIKIEVAVQEKIEFNDNINLAQAKIEAFLEEKTAGIDHDLHTLVNSAFQTNKGRLDTKRILGLFSLEIKHPTWLEAMELVKKSIDRNYSKRYMRVFQRDAEGQYHNIDLNLSSI